MMDPLLLQAAKIASQYLEHVDDRPVGIPPDRDRLEQALGPDLTDDGEPAETVIDSLGRTASDGLVASAGGRFFGFVVGANLPVSVAADWLVSAWDQNTGFDVLSPTGAVIEQITGRWLKELLNIPNEAAIGFVTGCQMANFMALAAARQDLLDRQGWDVALQGLNQAPPLRLITSAQSHGTIDRAFAMLGLGADRPIRIPCDDQGRMLVDRLADALQHETTPAIVCAQAGNVDSGSFDRLKEIGCLCKQHEAWLHIDGAFGLWAAASPQLRSAAEGAELADSWATDAHKWLNVPYDSGIVAVRNADALIRSTRYRGDYLVRGRDVDDPYMFTPESSRRARAIPIFAALKTLGRNGVAQLVERCCERARQMSQLLAAGGMEIVNDVVLNQVLFRIPPTGTASDDDFTAELLTRIQRDGTCWLGGTVWKGRRAMRISVSSWRTTPEDIHRSADAILRQWRIMQQE
ncbi:MAG: pyridoxal-dependent decarboxylase [Phycisphaerales bacterium]|nr:pyridoxal-dependent decarboxylase [Phycisphaerales bacterium]